MRGDDSLFGDAGDDTFSIYSTFGNDTIIGSETGETTGDTLDFTYAGGVTVDLSALDPEAGTFTDGTSISSFIEIENILLGNGRDTVILADGSGADAVQAFDMADSGDGTTNDQLDVSGLTSDGGTTPVTTADVTVTANGDGDAVLTFTGGETITLIGVSPSQLDTYAELEAIGIPGQSANFIVEGSSGDDIIDVNYTNDPGGDLVDANDHSDGSHSDVIESYQGNDSIDAGLGNDTVWAGADDDFVDGGVGADIIYGEGGSDTLYGGDGNDVVRGGAGGDLLAGDGGNDTLFGDAGNDTLFGDANNDSLVGGAGADTFWDGTGNDISDGGADADTFFTQFNTGTDTIIGGETGDDNDALISFKNVDSTLDLTAGGTAADNESGTLTTSVDSVTFSQIETITLSSGDDMVIGSDGDDVVNTDAGEDTVDGGAGNDTFNNGMYRLLHPAG
jgi:Ca2+-binding RTX toxin-like protein